jgi:uncharacterized protein (DUF2252 family)
MPSSNYRAEVMIVKDRVSEARQASDRLVNAARDLHDVVAYLQETVEAAHNTAAACFDDGSSQSGTEIVAHTHGMRDTVDKLWSFVQGLSDDNEHIQAEGAAAESAADNYLASISG